MWRNEEKKVIIEAQKESYCSWILQLCVSQIWIVSDGKLACIDAMCLISTNVMCGAVFWHFCFLLYSSWLDIIRLAENIKAINWRHFTAFNSFFFYLVEQKKNHQRTTEKMLVIAAHTTYTHIRSGLASTKAKHRIYRIISDNSCLKVA